MTPLNMPPVLRQLPTLLVFTESTLSAEPERVLLPLLERLPPREVLVTVRDKQLTFRQRLQIGERLRGVIESTGQLLGVSERLDLALSLGASALHLPVRGVLAEDARRLLPQALLTRAVHLDDDLAEQERAGLDALVVSPILAPRKGRAALGVLAVGQFAERYPGLPLYALGGVTPEGVAACLAAGFAGVVVQGAALGGEANRLAQALVEAMAARARLNQA